MEELEKYAVNDTMIAIREVAKRLRNWSEHSEYADKRHVAMVLTKLEEAELLCQRIVKY